MIDVNGLKNFSCYLLCLFLLLLLSGCEKYYVSVRNIPIDASYLASSAVGTPDPRQANPPFGQKLVIDWDIPPELLDENPRIVLNILYKNHTEKEVIYPISHKRGYEVFDLLNQQFFETQGFLCYRAELLIGEGRVYREWRHQLWVNLITLKELEERSSPAEESSASVSSQPKQGSVIETPLSSEEKPLDDA